MNSKVCKNFWEVKMNNLPKGWVEKTIGNLGNVITGKTPPSKLDNMFNGDILFVTPADIKLDIVKSERTVTENGREKSKIARKGSTLVSCIGNIGYVGNISYNSCFNQQINAIEWYNEFINDRFGTFSVLFHKEIIKSKASSAVVPIINKSTFESVKLSYPKNPESQKLIVKILDHAHKIIKEREKAIKLCEQLIEATFYEMFGDPVKNEKGWGKVQLSDEDYFDLIMGQSPPSNTYNNSKEGLPFYQGKTDFGYIYPKVRMWCSSPSKISECKDILISVRAPVGSVNICEEKSCIGRGLAAIRSKKHFTPEFLFYFFLLIEEHLNNTAHGSTFKSITKENLRKIQMVKPDNSLIEKFSEIALQNLRFRKEMKDALKLEKQQFQALLQAAFEGKLTAHLDGEDE